MMGAFLLVINPDRLGSRAAFDANVAAWLATYVDAVDGGARYPGQRAAECEIERHRSGIPLEPNDVRVLVEAGELAGCPFDLSPLA